MTERGAVRRERGEPGATRRRVLRDFGVAGLLLGLERWASPVLQASEPTGVLSGEPGALVPFPVETQFPHGTLFGPGLDGRRLTDLDRAVERGGRLDPEEFFVRTGPPPGLPAADRWTIEVTGLVERPGVLSPADLLPEASDRGEVALECAGNGRPLGFGLLSAAGWTGVPLIEILERAGLAAGAAAVLVEGHDDHARGSTNSTLGCGWILPLDAVDRTGAFLAVGLEGEDLRLENGAPIRLVVPGWYACSAVKWVHRITVVGADVPSTSQMIEFAARTHQNGLPAKALDYRDPVVDLAAVAVRAQRRRSGDRSWIAVSGLAWGGTEAVPRLEIRFRPDEPWRPVDEPPQRSRAETWGVWHHRWEPRGPGRFLVQLRPAGRFGTRLGTGFYMRALELG